MFILTRQVPFDSFSSLGNIAVISLFLIYVCINPKILKDNIGVFLWVGILFGYSLVCQNEITHIVRFTIIFTLIILAYNIILPLQIIKIFFTFILIQAIFLIIFELILLLFFNMQDYMPLRFFFLNKSWGDVYTYSGLYYLIQIKGNALLPFAYMLTFLFNFKTKIKKWILRIILFLSVIIAGNFAFFISLFCFHFFRYINIQSKTFNIAIRRILFISILGVLLAPIIYSYTLDTLDRKSRDSLSTRSDQIDVLFTDLNENLLTLCFGQGLGNTISIKTSYRDYTDSVYYELQTVYLLNQIGLVNFMLFFALNIYLAIKKISNKSLLWLYLCYIIYAFTNPYLFDTTHIVVIIILLSINNYYDKNRMCFGSV